MTSAAPAAVQHEYWYLDLVRIVAAQSVVVGHAFNLFFPQFFMHPTSSGMLEGRTDLFAIQNLGVGAFFVISGYLITMSAMRTHRRNCDGLIPYLTGRFRRIYGPLLPFLLILFAIESMIYVPHAQLDAIVVNNDIQTLVLNLLLLADHPLLALSARMTGWDFLHAGALGTAAQLWTVFVEWWIYVLFGAIYFGVVECRFTIKHLVLLAIALPVPLYWLAKGNALPVAWMIGMAFAFFDQRVRTMPVTALSWTCAACLGFAALHVAAASWSLYHPLFIIPASAGLMLGSYIVPMVSIGRSPLARLISYLSDRSYSLYLVHLSVLMAISTFVTIPSGGIAMALGIIAANLTAIVFHHAFERRWLPKSRHLQPPRQAS